MFIKLKSALKLKHLMLKLISDVNSELNQFILWIQNAIHFYRTPVIDSWQQMTILISGLVIILKWQSITIINRKVE